MAAERTAAGEDGQPAFETALQALTEIVEQLEQGDLTLDQALQLFEKGAGLARQCHQYLDQAEGKIQLLLEEHGDVLQVSMADDGLAQAVQEGATLELGGSDAATSP